ncbi:protein disulfide isomerase-like 1-5 isoform X2 [Malania oleifera]|uniref:protein disulfide isomerase-like 1-5 isoform X2 n=1 Tax=Malania oleifera TaxID=397392 RepID=UPI0025ADF1AB|nr:protein disulfide isomerase-like 1-5 isoform X2 [Malania oleifera]
MRATKPTSRFIYFSLTLLILLGFLVSTISAEAGKDGNDDDDLEEIEELIALDEEEEAGEQGQEGSHVKFSEAEVLSKAQRIVLELNGDNTKRVIDGNEFVLVLGYAPWCGRSAELMPQFAEAATSLKELGSSILMAKLDADRYPKAASVLGIKGFPTLILFVNGSSQAYTGGFSSEEIVIWVRKKTGVPVTRLNTVAEAAEFLKKHPVFVIGLFQNFEGPDYKEFVKAATSDNELQFVEVSNTEVAKVLFPEIKTVKHFVGLVKSEPERHTAYEGTFELYDILQFLDYNKFPLVTTLTELNSVRVYTSSIKLQVLVFAEANDFMKLLEPLQDIARKFRTKIMFIYVDITNDNLAKPYLTLFGLEESETTVVTAFDNKISSKYLLELDPTPRNIEDFCLGLLQNSLSPYFKSQPVPDNKDARIQTIVGKTFDDLVLSNTKNVFLEVHTPWCVGCETTSKKIEKLAKHFKGSENLRFARIDASANEHPYLQVI